MTLFPVQSLPQTDFFMFVTTGNHVLILPAVRDLCVTVGGHFIGKHIYPLRLSVKG
jgi:hypothetical protein